MRITFRCLILFSLLLILSGLSRAESSGDNSYTIKPGDTLIAIAKRFSIADYHSIAKENNIENPHRIYAGVIIRIPATSNEQQAMWSEEVATPQEVGVASWYGKYHHGRKTASSETYDMHALTVAHPTLPFGTMVRIENTKSGKSAIARVNDRGPFVNGRIVDVSYRVATILGIVKSGTGIVRLSVLEKQNRATLGALGATSSRKDLESTHQHDVMSHKATDGILLSEVVVTKYGPAHVIDGLNRNRIPKERAVALLFPQAGADVHGRLLTLVNENRGEEIVLSVGDVFQQMLPAEGIVYKNVLQAQISDAGLLATCYALYDEGLARSYLIAKETRSGNWYAEESDDMHANNACRRIRNNQKGGNHTENINE